MKRKKNNYCIITLALLASLLVFAGCKKTPEPVAQPKAAVKLPMPKPAPVPTSVPVSKSAPMPAPVPVQKQSSSAKVPATAGALLDFKNKKDPFKPFIVPAEPTASKAAPIRIRSSDLLPIQSYDVGKFTVSGIITGLKENQALVTDPAGKGYVVRQGMLIGNNDGRITRISSSSIEVIEQNPTGSGHGKKRKIVLPLAKKK
jgi:type IV pilus assembly protein PilP